jgi:L-threonylcarbamoyladenylate synthase
MSLNSPSSFISPWHIQQASRAMLAGGVIAYPTEGVWGLGCCWDDDAAIDRILELKLRPQKKGVIVLCSALEDMQDYLQPLSAEQKEMIAEKRERPTTWILPCKDSVSKMIRGKHHSIAVRFSDHPIVQQLCAASGPIISTSANPAGRPPAMNSLEIRQYFDDRLDYIMPGALGGHKQPSQIRTLDGQIVR